MQEFKRYKYKGPVNVGDKCVGIWSGTTLAVSKKKAENNLKYQFKKQSNLIPSVKVTFFNAVEEVI